MSHLLKASAHVWDGALARHRVIASSVVWPAGFSSLMPALRE
jgi:hypothetical protein